jgi:type II secretory pathway component GspD/PulD (secretin)
MTVPALVLVIAAGCGASRAAKRGDAAVRAGDWDSAVAHFTKAVQESPKRPEYKIQLERAMLQASYAHLERARQFDQKGEYENAIVEYRRTTEFDPSNRGAMMRAAELERIVRDRFEASRPKPPIDEMKEQVRRQAQQPLLNPASREPLDLRFTQASTQDILNFISSATGINVMYERDFRPAPFSIQLEDVTLEDALNQIMAANQLWYKVINERTILVIPDNNQKRQQYEELVIRTFYISHADPQELSQMLAQIVRMPGMAVQPTVAVNKTANTITVRGTKGVVEIIEKIIEGNDRPRAEVLVDVEILEVNRTRAKEYGINLTQYQVGAIFSPEVAPPSEGAVPPFNLNTITRGISTADFFMSVPQAVARFLATDSLTRLISRPQLRGTEGQKLTLNLGDEVPVPSTVFTPIATGGAATNPLTSFSYRPVGVNLELTPRVTYAGEIVMDVLVESSNVGESITIAGQDLPTFGSRKATTRLRLREGESNLLAGLLRKDELRRLRGFPGIMNLPFFKQVFSSNDISEGESDIVILITPRILRTHELSAENLSPIYIGTQQNIGLSDAPRLISVGEEPPPEPAAATPPAATPAQPFPAGAAPPGMPVPSAGAAPGVPQAPAAAAPGVPQTTPTTSQPQPRLPEGTTPRPVAPAGTSPIPGTTTLPPPQPPTTPPVTTAPPATTAPPGTTPAQPTEPAQPAPGAQPPAGPSVAQVLITTPGTEFRLGGGPYTVPVSVNGASRFSTVSLSLTFNAAVLRVRAVQEGSFLRQGGISVTFTQQVDAAAGRVDISMTRTGDTVGASGSGLLAAVLFEPVAAGSATLTLSGVATNPQGGPVPLSFAPVTVTVK